MRRPTVSPRARTGLADRTPRRRPAPRQRRPRQQQGRGDPGAVARRIFARLERPRHRHHVERQRAQGTHGDEVQRGGLVAAARERDAVQQEAERQPRVAGAQAQQVGPAAQRPQPPAPQAHRRERSGRGARCARRQRGRSPRGEQRRRGSERQRDDEAALDRRLHPRIEIAALPIELAGHGGRDDPPAHEQHQQGEEQHCHAQDRMLGGREAGLAGQVEGDAAGADRRQHQRQRLVAPLLGRRQQPRRQPARQQRGEGNVGHGRREALRGPEERGARQQPQPREQGQARDGHGAELVAHDHGEGEAEQHLVGVSGARGQRRDLADEAQHRQHRGGQDEDRIGGRQREEDHMARHGSPPLGLARVSGR